uniref:MOSC domain-containing protein n=1 Tax=Panagrolaimus sp. JU765 TaxID=591449 RepID=A0AC34QN91_9BILA
MGATVCINNFQAVDCGKSASDWFHGLHPTVPENLKVLRLLDVNCSNDQSNTFNNVADYLLITWASIRTLAEIVNLAPETVMSRFRANFVIESGNDVPFDEDSYKRIWIGGIGFEVVSRCTRCQMIAIDQKTGEKDPNVLLALRNLRFGDKVAFGVYLRKMTTNAVEISVGSTIKIDRSK